MLIVSIVICQHLSGVLQVLGKDVAYELLPYSTRRDLHAKLAQAYEESKGSQKVAPSRIAFHYSRSCNTVEVAEWHRTVKVSIEFQHHLHACKLPVPCLDGLPNQLLSSQEVR